jgi:hypothetical protein
LDVHNHAEFSSSPPQKQEDQDDRPRAELDQPRPPLEHENFEKGLSSREIAGISQQFSRLKPQFGGAKAHSSGKDS